MLNRIAIAASAVMMTAPLAMSGPIDTACVRSDRARGNAPLCGCIQQVADQTLSRSDQRRAAAFFRDPNQAQAVRMSKRDADNAFWARYKRFAGRAEALCR
ncbi:MAG: hypothetical protein ACU0BZ_09125 [Paracoccus sp. (in: a-proteobacteria)]|uniref:hypothetical protein n=2 Tax=Paracoccus TaxID=265 RepID=UPI000C3BFF30|nr:MULTISPECIES: hypothetical protein [unclassified Paracoccus (in: a-proteobacteria)]MBA48419.1 hypothetical protein [Paracoccus sp. (in: a-proteobacteria)]|tara:strand:- start:346 stop:648 length:303 start_codon:yes stop_codon:yes gene_type:complete